MFHPDVQPMERGWVGRVDGERVIHLAAQTLQAFFLGGGGAREHAEYRLDEVTLLVPVLYPPAVRVFGGDGFEFANPAAVLGPGATISPPEASQLELLPRVAAVIGANGEIGGYSCYTELRAPGLATPKDRDFGSAFGPVVVTPEELDGTVPKVVVRVDGEQRMRGQVEGFDWERARVLAAAGTILRPGDVLVSPPVGTVDDIAVGSRAELEVSGIGTLALEVSS
jgi:hypothetical protein